MPTSPSEMRTAKVRFDSSASIVSQTHIDGRLTALLFCVALAPREEQPFAANRRGSGLSRIADFCTARREQQF